MEHEQLVEQHKLERDYFLGKTQVDPNTGLTVTEGKTIYAQSVADAEADLEQRMKRYQDTGDQTPAPDPPVVITNLPDEKALKRLSRNDIVEQATKEGVDTDPGETIAQIAEKILEHRLQADGAASADDTGD